MSSIHKTYGTLFSVRTEYAYCIFVQRLSLIYDHTQLFPGNDAYNLYDFCMQNVIQILKCAQTGYFVTRLRDNMRLKITHSLQETMIKIEKNVAHNSCWNECQFWIINSLSHHFELINANKFIDLFGEFSGLRILFCLHFIIIYDGPYIKKTHVILFLSTPIIFNVSVDKAMVGIWRD